jgi:Carboxypeptidase regulatory-like domain
MRTPGLSVLVLCIIAGTAFPVLAQTGQIAGQVTDSSGAALPKAEVRAINQDTLIERHTQTNDAGLYTFSFVAPGVYQVAVEAPGFSTAPSEKLTLRVGQALVFNVQLKVGQTRQHTTVSAESQTIDTTDAQVSNIVDERELQSLPNILRDPYQLILLSSGVNATNNNDGGFSVNGGRETANRFLLDGGENNDVEFPAGGLTSINPDSAQEFRVITNNFMPEYGRSDGAVIDVVTKSGSNLLHGDVYEFGRWDVLGARDYFNHNPDPLTGNIERKNPYIRNIFGASLGGPIVRDQTFFFFNYEEHRFNTTLSAPFTVPTQQFLTGKFTYNGVDGNGNPISVPVDVSSTTSGDNAFGLPLDPLAKKIFQFYPAPNLLEPNGIDGIAFIPQVQLSNSNNYTVKIDHAFSPSENLSARYALNTGLSTNQFQNELQPGLAGIDGTSRAQTLSASLVSANYRWQNYLISSMTRLSVPGHCTALNTLNGLGQQDIYGDTADIQWPFPLQPWGCSFLGDTDAQTRGSGSYDFSDHVTRTAGRHTIKFGGAADQLYSNNAISFFSRGVLEFFNFAEFGAAADQSPAAQSLSFFSGDQEALQDAIWALFGQATLQTQSQFFTPGGSRMRTDELHMRAHDFSFFGQDSFRASHKLTLNYGLLWEFNGVPYETDNLLSTVPVAELSGPAPITFQNVGQNGVYLYKRHWLVPQPRVGFAWDPFGDGKTSIRGGVGIFRDRTFFQVADIIRGDPPLNEQFSNIIPVNAMGAFVPGPAIWVLASPTTRSPNPVIPQGALFGPEVLSQNLSLPYSENWNLGIQRQLQGDVQLEINYVGVMGKKLLRNIDGNQPIPAKVAALRAFCTDPTDAFPNLANTSGCVDSPTASSQIETVTGLNLYNGAETPGPLSNPSKMTIVPLLPFDAVNNNAVLHPVVVADEGNSSYNGLQATITKKFSHGLYIQGAYTWSHVIDDAALPFNAQAGQTEFPTNSFNPRADRGNGSYDVRQVLVMNYVWELPMGRHKPYLNRGLAGKVFEGFTLSGITDFSGGFPYDIFSPLDTAGNGGGADPNRADYNPHIAPVPVQNPRTQISPNPAFFVNPPYGRAGDLGRDTFRAPGINNWDAVLSKTTRVNDRFSFEFRGECYNIFNRVQFSPPPLFNDFVGDSVLGQSLQQAQRADSTSGARQLQFALKLKF